MSAAHNIDGVLIKWGDRLFYPGNRVVKSRPMPKLSADTQRHRAAAIRERIAATVVRRAPQVMVKVTGGGHDMKTIAAHFRYISKNGKLDIEDDRGERMQGREVLRDLADEWRFGGSLIDEAPRSGQRREAFNIMLSMPSGTSAWAVQQAARGFAKTEFTDHAYVMVLHDHQANPHVHLSVRAESRHGKRLNPRKADLHRWRETFAEKLRDLGIDAEATRQATRGNSRNYESLWRQKASEAGRMRAFRPRTKDGWQAQETRADAQRAWQEIAAALSRSDSAGDKELANAVIRFANGPERSARSAQVAPELGQSRRLPGTDGPSR